MIPTLVLSALVLAGSFAVGWALGTYVTDVKARHRNDTARHLAMVGAMRRMSGGDK